MENGEFNRAEREYWKLVVELKALEAMISSGLSGAK